MYRWLKCVCGAEYEFRGWPLFGSHDGATSWIAMHMHCVGVQHLGRDKDDPAKLIVTRYREDGDGDE